MMLRNFNAMMQRVMNGQEVSIEDRVRYRYQAATVIGEMIRAVDLLFDVAGGRSVYRGSEIQQIWHDIHIDRAHVANSPVSFARNWGNMMLGGENQDFFI
jgi:3-hydroxy-9,10-secoandrosta-1,3,5(10)-triene-9,17-dione monooxygenase